MPRETAFILPAISSEFNAFPRDEQQIDLLFDLVLLRAQFLTTFSGHIV